MSESGPGFYRDEVCSRGLVLLEDTVGGFDGRHAGLVKGLVSTVVQKDVGGTTPPPVAHDALDHVRDYLIRRKWVPVEGGNVPLDGGEAQLASCAENEGATRSVRSTEVADWSAEGIFERGIAISKLLPDTGGGLPGQPRMSHEVEHHIHESPKSMTVPLIILALCAICV